jgi:tRNA threonylcarbamoyladenosine modification (KEOPS) complex Cgi121 subunit
METEMISKRDAEICVRIAVAIDRQIERAFDEGREADAGAMCRLSGRLMVLQFDYESHVDGPLAHPRTQEAVTA